MHQNVVAFEIEDYVESMIALAFSAEVRNITTQRIGLARIESRVVALVGLKGGYFQSCCHRDRPWW